MTVPLPRKNRFNHGELAVTDPARITIDCDADLLPAADWWADATKHAFGVETGPEAAVTLTLRHAAETAKPIAPSGYKLGIFEGQINIDVSDLSGAFAALQTLRQLAGPQAFRQAPLPGASLVLPTGTISDAPRLAWRGVMLDVARHFMPPRDVRRFIDLAAMHHLNVVQLHLTDDQGWRFQTDRYPELTAVGSHRQGDASETAHGGYYTKDDLRETVAFAKQRGVTVVPEIDLPGHVEAAIAAYPWLGTSKKPRGVTATWGISEDVLDPGPNQVSFFCDVLGEVCDVFDSPFVHIGGDEVPLTRWQGNLAIEARAAALDLLDDKGNPSVARLHGWFLAQLATFLRLRRRRAIVWDEACGPDLPPDVIVMAWRGLPEAARALAQGFDVVLAPEQHVYLDHRASDRPDEPSPYGDTLTTQDVYAFDTDMLRRIDDADVKAVKGGVCQIEQSQQGSILGAQAQLWSERLEDSRRVDYAAFPRLAAFSEAVWGSAPKQRDPGSPASAAFMARLEQAHLPRLAAAGVEYRPVDGPLPWQKQQVTMP